MTNQEKISSIIRHIKKVEDNCNIIAKHFEKEGFLDLALLMIKLGREHDLSKFDKYEFKNLNSQASEDKFKIALALHQERNKHHPEYWIKQGETIHQMPVPYLAEMVCDCVARAQEFGTDARKWFENEATVKYGFKMEDIIGKAIKEYLDLLLPQPFKKSSEKVQ